MKTSFLHLDHLAELWPRLLAALPVALLVILGAVMLAFLVNRSLTLLARHTRLSDENIVPFRKVARVAIMIATLVLILNVFGFSLGGLWTVLSTVLAMVAIGFVAVWSVLSNTLCTFIILLSRPFAIGDEVEFTGEQVSGRVEDMNFIYTTLRCDDGSVLQIPNNLFFQRVLRRRAASAPGALAAQLNRSNPPSLSAPARAGA